MKLTLLIQTHHPSDLSDLTVTISKQKFNAFKLHVSLWCLKVFIKINKML